MPDAADAINRQTLQVERKRHGLSQQQLAVAIGCTKDTVSRWERGTSSRVRPHLRKPLCKALHVTWEQLTKPADRTSGESAYLNPTIKASIGERVRTPLQLAAARYGVRPQNVLDIAPLLFVIVAERSLLERERRLQELSDAIDHAEGILSEHFRHFGGCGVSTHTVESEDPFYGEKAALDNRDVFGSQMDSSEGPFIHFVRNLAKGLPEDAVGPIDPAFGGSTIGEYRIAEDTLRDITGISGDDEENKKLLDHIRSGLINLADCMRAKRDRDEGQYRQWLSEELSRADAESQRRLEQFWHSLGLSPDKAKSMLERGSGQ